MLRHSILFFQARKEVQDTYVNVWEAVEAFLMEGDLEQIGPFFQEVSRIPQPNYLKYALSSEKKKELMKEDLGQQKVITSFEALISSYQDLSIDRDFFKERLKKEQEQLERAKSFYELFWNETGEVIAFDPKRAKAGLISLKDSLHPEKCDEELARNPYFVSMPKDIMTGSDFVKTLETVKVVCPLYGICIALANEMQTSLKSSTKGKNEVLQKVKKVDHRIKFHSI